MCLGYWDLFLLISSCPLKRRGKIQSIEDKVIINLGDSLLQKEWAGLSPDILMIPIGGLGGNVWTMDITEALEAVKLISPKKVIPCHYNASFLWIMNAAPADEQLFKRLKREISC